MTSSAPPFFQAPCLKDLKNLRHAFFTRKGGVSKGHWASCNAGLGSGDQLTDVYENRRRCAEALGVSVTNLLTPHQIHGKTVLSVPSLLIKEGIRPQADAFVTSTPGYALGIVTADCAPVLLADPEAGVIGAVHAGWRGARLGILQACVIEMEKHGAMARRIHAAVGPLISQAAYEVGAALREEFMNFSPLFEAKNAADFFMPSSRPEHFLFDLRSCLVSTLRACSVRIIDHLPLCTYTEEELFFSYRRATHRGEADYGRQLSMLMLTPE